MKASLFAGAIGQQEFTNALANIRTLRKDDERDAIFMQYMTTAVEATQSSGREEAQLNHEILTFASAKTRWRHFCFVLQALGLVLGLWFLQYETDKTTNA